MRDTVNLLDIIKGLKNKPNTAKKMITGLISTEIIIKRIVSMKIKKKKANYELYPWNIAGSYRALASSC
ncbi:MAG: hypothetical protein ACPK85_09765 [Methanosarcina sp.]